MAYIGGPIEDVGENFVLVGRLGLRIVGNLVLQVRDGARETGEIVKCAGFESVMEMVNEIYQELLRSFLILGEMPNHVAGHDVLGSQPRCRPLQCMRDHNLLADVHVLDFGLAGDRNGILHE